MTTPSGTDIRFRVGDRAFNKQDGDASAQRMESARIRIDRETGLPCGVLRVAPLEESAHQVLAVPEARLQETIARGIARGIRFEFIRGRMIALSAEENSTLWRRTWLKVERPPTGSASWASVFTRVSRGSLAMTSFRTSGTGRESSA